MHTPRRPILRNCHQLWCNGLLLALVSLLPAPGGAAFGTRSPAIPVAYECTVRRWHDALRRLRNPAEGYGFSRALGFFLMALVAAPYLSASPDFWSSTSASVSIGFVVSHSTGLFKMKNAAPAVVAGGD